MGLKSACEGVAPVLQIQEQIGAVCVGFHTVQEQVVLQEIPEVLVVERTQGQFGGWVGAPVP